MKWRAVVALAAALFMLAGCGKAIGEKAAENLINSVLDGTGAEVSSDGSLTLTGEDGSKVNFSMQDEGKVPDSFVLPVFPGMKTDGFVETRTDGKLGWIGTLYFDGDIEQVALEYEQALKNLGLEPGMMGMKDDDGYTAMFFVSGEMNGKHYSGMLAMAQNDDEDYGLGSNALSILFNEVDPDE